MKIFLLNIEPSGHVDSHTNFASEDCTRNLNAALTAPARAKTAAAKTTRCHDSPNIQTLRAPERNAIFARRFIPIQLGFGFARNKIGAS
jgi:hypothetical protein